MPRTNSGYRRITIERPLRLSYQFSDEHISTLRFAAGVLNGAMQWIYSEYGQNGGEQLWDDAPDCEDYGDLTADNDEIRTHLKRHFADLKEKQIKDLLARDTWLAQKQILLKARQLQKVIGTAQFDDFNAYDDALKAAAKKLESRSTAKRKSRSLTR